MNATQYQLLTLAAERMLALLPGQALTFTLSTDELDGLRERRTQLKLDRITEAGTGVERFTFSLRPTLPPKQDVSAPTNEVEHAHR